MPFKHRVGQLLTLLPAAIMLAETRSTVEPDRGKSAFRASLLRLFVAQSNHRCFHVFETPLLPAASTSGGIPRSASNGGCGILHHHVSRLVINADEYGNAHFPGWGPWVLDDAV